MKIKQILGIVGSIMMIVGVFAPMIKIPIIGSMSFFDNNKLYGSVIAIVALLSLIIAFKNRYKLLWLTLAVILAVMGFTAWEAYKPMSSFKAKASKILGQRLTDKIVDKVSDKAMDYVKVQWGLALLIVGLILLILSAVIPTSRSSQINEVSQANQ